MTGHSVLGLWGPHGYLHLRQLHPDGPEGNRWRAYRRSFHPADICTRDLSILKPITTTVVVLNVMWIWNDFLLPLLMMNSTEERGP